MIIFKSQMILYTLHKCLASSPSPPPPPPPLSLSSFVLVVYVGISCNEMKTNLVLRLYRAINTPRIKVICVQFTEMFQVGFIFVTTPSPPPPFHSLLLAFVFDKYFSLIYCVVSPTLDLIIKLIIYCEQKLSNNYNGI